MPIKLGGECTQENVTPAAAEGIKDSESWLPLTFFFFFSSWKLEIPVPSPPSSPDFPCNKAAVRKAQSN